MAPEGHRPRPPGLDPRAPLDRRRHRLRPHPAQLRRQGQPQGAPAGVPRGAARPGRARHRRGHGPDRLGRPRPPSAAVEYLRQAPDGLAGAARCCWCSRTSTRSRRAPSATSPGVYVLAAAELETVDIVAARAILVERSVWERLTGGEPAEVEAVSPAAQGQARAARRRPPPKPAPRPSREAEAEPPRRPRSPSARRAKKAAPGRRGGRRPRRPAAEEPVAEEARGRGGPRAEEPVAEEAPPRSRRGRARPAAGRDAAPTSPTPSRGRGR